MMKGSTIEAVVVEWVEKALVSSALVGRSRHSAQKKGW